jgi:oxepin-CoA hydrolase/3-oxo-5,6-dehydrosuberyl-CoA semialdehyde dehydrogenase
MTAHQVVCHIADAFRVADGSKTAGSVSNWFTRNIMKRIALMGPFRPPRGIRAPKEVDQLQDGTPPTAFEDDRAETLRLIERFRALPADHRFGPHPLLGPLTHREWLIFHHKHLDHHLRQFGC